MLDRTREGAASARTVLVCLLLGLGWLLAPEASAQSLPSCEVSNATPSVQLYTEGGSGTCAVIQPDTEPPDGQLVQVTDANGECDVASEGTTRTVVQYNRTANTWDCPFTGGGMSDLVSDTTPQLGGPLGLNGQNVETGTATLAPAEFDPLDNGIEDADVPDTITIDNATNTGGIDADADATREISVIAARIETDPDDDGTADLSIGPYVDGTTTILDWTPTVSKTLTGEVDLVDYAGTITTSANNSLYRGINWTSTISQNTVTAGVSDIVAFRFAINSESTTASVLPPIPTAFADESIYRAQNVAAGTFGSTRHSLFAIPSISALGAGGSIGVTNYSAVHVAGSLTTDTAGGSATLGTRRGLHFLDPTLSGAGTETVTDNIAVDIEALAAGATLNIGVRSAIAPAATNYFLRSTGAAQSVHAGNLRIGDTSDPTVPLDVVGSSDLNGALTLWAGKGGSSTDVVVHAPARGDLVGAPHNVLNLNPTGNLTNTATLPRIARLGGTFTRTGTCTLCLVVPLIVDTRSSSASAGSPPIRNDGIFSQPSARVEANVDVGTTTSVRGVYSQPVVGALTGVGSSAAITVTDLTAFLAEPTTSAADAGQSVTVTTARGFRVMDLNASAGSGTSTVTTQVGLDVEAMTAGATQIAIRSLGTDDEIQLAGPMRVGGTGAPTAGVELDVVGDLSVSGTLIATHAASHQDGGADEVATATPGADAIPKAGAGGALAAGFIPSDLVAQDLDTTGLTSGRVRVTAETISATLTAQQVSSGIVTNEGAGGAIVLTLPAAAQGMVVTVALSDALDVDVNPDDADQILGLTDAAGDAISSDAAAGSMVSLVAVSASEWLPLGERGTWTDVN